MHKLQKVLVTFCTRKISAVHHMKKRFLESGVYVSQCQDIYQNLALEDWIYEHVQCQNKNILLFWQNKPCVVIGRHQNPWTEANLELMNNRGVPLARRKSGGGTVYHDLGNLNCTFFTSRKRYDRKYNLELVVKAIKDRWNLNVKVNERDDIVLNDKYKISGTAAKLGKQTAYHHFTLLISADKHSLLDMLNTPLSNFSTRATESVKSDIMNLVDVQPSLSDDELVRIISTEYYNSVLGIPEVKPSLLDPTHTAKFPGIEEISTHFKSWDWKYGWTPKFTIEKTFTTNSLQSNVISGLRHLQQDSSSKDIKGNSSCNNLDDRNNSLGPVAEFGEKACVTISLECNKGHVEHVRLSSQEIKNIDQYAEVIGEMLKGVWFNYSDMKGMLLAQDCDVMENSLDVNIFNWLSNCVLSLAVEIM